MPQATTFIRLLAALLVMSAFGSAPAAASPDRRSKLDPLLEQRASLSTGRSRIIVRAVSGAPRGVLKKILQERGGTPGRALSVINGHAATVPNAALAALEASPFIEHISLDRLVVGATERTGATVGAASVRQVLGFDGSGVGVAIIDSGVTSWHDDLTGGPDVAQRIDRFVDLVNGGVSPYDDYGHGTHVAGIVAGNGFDSDGARSGIAPGARLTVLKVLDGSGQGRISDVIAAFDYIVANKDALNIRVVNLSITAAAYESFDSDPLTSAARRAVTAGIVVVAAAGNSGRGPEGRTQYGGVMAPGNAPWVVTVGASSHMGTVDRADDSIAAFSSRGPGAGGSIAKPDIVAPGVGIESLSDSGSAFYTSRSSYLMNGTVATSYQPYLSLSGTSMATPVVTGTVALMLQANPALTPNQVKAILQYTAQAYPGYDALTQGAGFLNAKGAVELAQLFTTLASGPIPISPEWSGRIIWGNRLVQGGRLTTDANAWSPSVTWGALTTSAGENIQWGVACSAVACDLGGGTWDQWGVTSTSENVVWGSLCGGDDCQGLWTAATVFGTNDSDTVVWGTDDTDTVVWGLDDEDTVVWGLSCDDPSCEPVIWGRQ
jgi:serine protease AprX